MIANEEMQKVVIDAVRRGSRIASRAQQAIMQSSSSKTTKLDSSPVTIADFAVQACISHILSKAYPTIKLLAEEDDESFRSLSAAAKADIVKLVADEMPDIEADEAKIEALIARGSFGKSKDDLPPCFVLDPIDGTKGFLRGEQYAVCLGFLEPTGVASIGALGCPNMPSAFLNKKRDTTSVGFLFEARQNAGTRMRKLFLDKDEEDVVLEEWSAAVPALDRKEHDLVFAESFEKSHTDGTLNRMLFSRFKAKEENMLRIDSQVKFACLARGDADVYLRFTSFDICNWDVLPGYVVLVEAGGRITDKNGGTIPLNVGRTIQRNSLIATARGCSHVHDEILQAINQHEQANDHEELKKPKFDT